MASNKVVTDGLVLAIDLGNTWTSFRGGPTTNHIPSASINGYPTVGNSWGTFNINQYNSGNYFSIGTISSVSSNIVTTSAAHPLRSFDVVMPQTTGGGVTAGTNYVVKKLSSTTFSLHSHNASEDGSLGYINPATALPKVYDNWANNVQIAVNSTSFPTMWWGYPHIANSGLVKEIRYNGFTNPQTGETTDCMRLNYIRTDNVKDGMAYGCIPNNLVAGTAYTWSFWVKPDNVSAGTNLNYQIYNYGANAALSVGNTEALGLPNVWQKKSLSFTANNPNLYMYWIPPSGNYGACKIDIANIQVEPGSIANPFTTSTRANNQSIVDVTGKNTVIANNLTYASNSAVSFNGSNNYITIIPSSSYNMFNIDMWLYNINAVPNNDSSIGGPTTYQTIVSFTNPSYAGISLGGWTGAGTNEAWHMINSQTVAGTMTYNREYTAPGWHHVSFNWNGGYYDVWIDGVKTTVYAGTNGHATLLNCSLMKFGGDPSYTYHFNGLLPILKSYNQPLTDDQVLQNFNALRTRFGK